MVEVLPIREDKGIENVNGEQVQAPENDDKDTDIIDEIKRKDTINIDEKNMNKTNLFNPNPMQNSEVELRDTDPCLGSTGHGERAAGNVLPGLEVKFLLKIDLLDLDQLEMDPNVEIIDIDTRPESQLKNSESVMKLDKMILIDDSTIGNHEATDLKLITDCKDITTNIDDNGKIVVGEEVRNSAANTNTMVEYEFNRFVGTYAIFDALDAKEALPEQSSLCSTSVDDGDIDHSGERTDRDIVTDNDDKVTNNVIGNTSGSTDKVTHGVRHRSQKLKKAEEPNIYVSNIGHPHSESVFSSIKPVISSDKPWISSEKLKGLDVKNSEFCEPKDRPKTTRMNEQLAPRTLSPSKFESDHYLRLGARPKRGGLD